MPLSLPKSRSNAKRLMISGSNGRIITQQQQLQTFSLLLSGRIETMSSASSQCFEPSGDAFLRSMVTMSPTMFISSTSIPPFEFSPPFPGRSTFEDFTIRQQQWQQNHSFYPSVRQTFTPPPYSSATLISPFRSGNSPPRPEPIVPLLENESPSSSSWRQPSLGVGNEPRGRRVHKSVRFSLLNQQVFTVPNDDEEPRQWLKQEDLDHQRTVDKHIIATVAHDEEYKNAISFLMNSFKAEHYVGRQQLLDHVRVLLQHPEARGLEHRIASILKSKRVNAVRQFLKHQRRIRSETTTRSETIAGTNNKLRQVSLKLSRGARQLAFRLAQGDRLAAKAIHEEEIGET